MLKKDYIIRLTEEFGKFLSVLMGLRKKGEWKEFERVLNELVSKFTGTEIEWVETLENENFLKNLSEKYNLSGEKLKILADLLYEKGMAFSNQNNEINSANCLYKAYLIYLHLKNSALDSDFSLDMHYKINLLNKIQRIK